MGFTKLLDWCAENREFGEMLLSEWTGVDEHGKNIDINKIYKGSHIRMKWECPKCRHVWQATVHDRTGDKTHCPKCREKERSDRATKAALHKGDNDLLTWCNNHGEYGEYLKREWTGFDSEGEYYTMDNVAKQSGKLFVWKCNRCSHEWPVSPSRRTGKNKSGCPECNKRSTSYPEQFLYHSLKSLFPDAVNRGKFQNVEFDIMIQSINTYIEYGSTFTHEGKEESDANKAQLCVRNGIRFISVFDDSKNEMEHYVRNDGICFNLDYRCRDEELKTVVYQLFTILGIDDTVKLDFEEIAELAFLRSHNIIAYEDSVENIFPKHINFWKKRYIIM